MKFDLRVLVGVAAAVTWGLASGAGAVPSHIGGQDGTSHYDSTTGRLSFGTGADMGIVTSDDQGIGLVGLSVIFEVELDNTPARTNQASFGGLPGGVTELRFVDDGGTPTNPLDDVVMLAFDVINLDWTQQTLGGGAGADRIVLGDQTPTNFGITSELRVAASPLANSVDGVGTPAVLEITLGGFTTNLANNPPAWGFDWDTNGITATTWNLNTLTAPEPSTALLVSAGLAGMAGLARRGRRRR